MWANERPLRVAHLLHGWYLGGLEQLVVEMASQGAARGAEAMVIALGQEGPIRDALTARGVPTHGISTAGLSAPTLRALDAALDDFGADVLHAHDLGPWLNAAAARVRRPRMAVLATFHQMAVPTGAKRVAALAAAAVTSAVVACGREVRAQLHTWLPRRARVATIGNGIRLPALPTPSERAAARARLGIPEGVVAVGYLGRMAQIKGPDLLLSAFVSAFGERGDVHLALIGDGPLDGALGGLARGRANVHRLGAVIDGRALLAGLDVYAQTSLTEGRSLAMLEAMAAGLPTVAHDLPGVREIHGARTALCVPLGDARALREALVALVESPERRSALGAAARAESLRYGVDATFDAYLSLYRELRA